MVRPKRSLKKPYSAPSLRCYGDLRRLTGGSSNKKNEGGAGGPKTKSSGAA